MNQSRFFFTLTSLIMSGYIALPILPITAQTVKSTNHHSKSIKSPHPAKNTKQSSNKSNQPQNNNDQDNQSTDDEDNKNPTQSLFEAINTGNQRGVQDALNRGADLRATNVLGQTPLEMSIDLNRDRITFLLLSMRGYNNSPQSLTSNGEISTVSVKNDKGYLSIKGKNQHHTTSNLNKTNVNVHHDNGIPKPEIGFLGFQKS